MKKPKRIWSWLNDFQWQDKDSKEKKMWTGVIVSMALIFGFWLWSVNSRMNRFFAQAPQQMSEIAQFQGADPAEAWERTQSEGEKILSDAQNRLTDETLKAMGAEYIKNRQILTGENFSELRLVDLKKGEAETELRYQHYYKTLPVVGSDLKVFFNSETGEEVREENQLAVDIKLDTNPVLSSQEAADIVLKQDSRAGETKTGTLMIVRRAAQVELVWTLEMMNEKTGQRKSFVVNAKTGKIITDAQLDR